MNPFHEANRRSWDAVSPRWQAGIDDKGLWRRCHADPGLALSAAELEALGDVPGAAVCVLGSGDNLVAFALAGMEARVTSVDFSQVQLATAAQRARANGLDIRFVRADVTALHAIRDGAFDVVYTGGHVAVWVADLRRYYAEACRILRRDGLLVVCEYHPFRKIWKDSATGLEVEFSYLDRGPARYDRSDMVADAEPDTVPSHEFRWTVGDMVSAVLAGGCELVAMQEFGDAPQEWETAPLSGLPENLLLVGRKR